MKHPLRALLLLLVGPPFLLIASCSLALPSYDNRTRQNVLRTVAAEVPPHASMKQMEQFMMRHAPGKYSYDDFNNRWQGLLPQTRLDRIIFDRQIGVDLKVDKKTGRFRGADAEIYYTFL